MFEYKKFNILEVAERCGISLDSRTLLRVEAEAWCPFCPTKSSSCHLYLNKEKERFVCYKCSAKGNSVSLYAQVFGISNKEAYERLSDEIGEGPAPELPGQKQAAMPTSEIAPLSRRHDVYYDLLMAMTLTEKHHRDMADRGLPRERIRQNLYRSMPDSFIKRRRIAEYLAKRHDLRGVPGFYYSEYGHWELCGNPGVLIPICDAGGYIQGLQIRLDNAGKKKYRWLSSNPDYGFPYGTASSAWVHVTGNRGNSEAFITEGGLKGDAASYLSGGLLFICTAGVSSIRYLADTLRSLRVTKVYGCYDMDQIRTLNKLLALRTDPYAKDAYKPCPLEKMEAMVKSTGLPYERCEWDAGLNGIDDYYLNHFAEQQNAS